MEIDITRIPRVARLLGRIEETRRKASDLPDGHSGRNDLEARANVLYAEVGRYVHWLVRQDPEAIERVRAEGLRWAESIDQELGLQPLPDVLDVPVADLPDDELFEASVAPSLELTADSRHGGIDVRALPRSARDEDVPALVSGAVQVLPAATARTARPAPAPAPAPARVPVLDEAELEPIAIGESDDLEEATNPKAEASGGGVAVGVRAGTPVPAPAAEPGEGAWTRALEELLDAVGDAGPVPADADRRVAQVRAVVAVTTNLEVRWSVFPQAVQQALLGLVGARTRRLQATLGDDPDLKLAVGRLRRFAEQRQLLLVPSLRPGAPAARDWEADERRYAGVLRAGL